MPNWDNQDCYWAPISGKPSQGPEQSSLARTPWPTIASLSAVISETGYFSGLRSNKLLLVWHCTHVGKRARKNHGCQEYYDQSCRAATG